MVDSIRKNIEEFLRDITCEYYNFGSGKKRTLDLTSIYKKYPTLFDKQTINEVPPEKRKLRGFLINTYLNHKTKDIQEEIARKKAEKRFPFKDKNITLSQLEVLIQYLHNRKEREKLHNLKIGFVKEIEPLKIQYLQDIYNTVPLFSYGRYFSYLVRIQNIDFSHYKRSFEFFLEETENVYTHNMNKYLLSKLGISLNSAALYDISYFFRGFEFDNQFKIGYIKDFLKEFLYNLGIDLEKQKNVHLDLEERPTKNPRAFCAPCEIPNNVYLSVLPQGGYKDFETTLHEMGHVEHFAHTSSTLRIEDRALGDMGLSEVFAFLFQYLLQDPVFVEYYFDMHDEELNVFIRHISLAKLYLIRRYVGKFLYEYHLHKKEDLQSFHEKYKEHLEKALYIKIPTEMALYDLDMDFYSANYLRAWFAESALSEFLRTKFGKKWFINKKAGDLLKELWFEGKRWQIEEMLDEVIGRPFDMEPLIEEVKRVLKS